MHPGPRWAAFSASSLGYRYLNSKNSQKSWLCLEKHRYWPRPGMLLSASDSHFFTRGPMRRSRNAFIRFCTYARGRAWRAWNHHHPRVHRAPSSSSWLLPRAYVQKRINAFLERLIGPLVKKWESEADNNIPGRGQYRCFSKHNQDFWEFLELRYRYPSDEAEKAAHRGPGCIMHKKQQHIAYKPACPSPR